MIHFQHDQAGATLRATELKPKLDQFIIEHALNALVPPVAFSHAHDAREKFKAIATKGIGELKKPEWRSWLVGKGNAEHVALDYRIVIDNATNSKYIIASRLSMIQEELLGNKQILTIAPSPFFAEEKSIGKLFEKDRTTGKVKLSPNFDTQFHSIAKLGLKTDELIGARIFCLDQNLLKMIKDMIPDFFIIKNFGCRQNKGFGSFSIETINREPVVRDVVNVLKKYFDIVFEKVGQFETSNPFSSIQADYKLMKAGRGSPEGYAKSRLFLYFADRGIRWEKRWIKQNIDSLTKVGDHFEGFLLLQTTNPGDPIDVDDSQDWIDKPTHNANGNSIQPPYAYIRALLGLAEMFDFQGDGTRDKVSVKVFGQNGVDRFQSPIHFKVIGQRIFITGNDNVPTSILNANSPHFDGYWKVNDQLIIGTKHSFPNPPTIPSKFSLKKFLDFCLWHDKENPKSDTEKRNRITSYRRLK
jgi:hypothetical protein